MSTRTFEQDFNGLSNAVAEGFASAGAAVDAGLRAMGPYGRRFAVTGFGAVLALSLGAVTAFAFRLPPEVADAARPQGQTLAQVEPPSIAAARAYALENPPVYKAKTDAADEAAVLDPSLPASSDAGPAIEADYRVTTKDLVQNADVSDDDQPVPPASAPGVDGAHN